MPVRKNLTSRQRIKYKIRKRIKGTAERPRLVVFRSLNNIYAQIIDDTAGRVLVSFSSNSREISKDKVSKTDKSRLVGTKIAEKALSSNIKKVVFDRNGYLYHGRVKALADAAREAGLEF
jgi:large subunit ribosomal protein L18